MSAPIPLTGYGDEDVKNNIDNLVKQRKYRSRSDFVIVAINDLLEREAELARMTREALQDVDSGNVIAQEDIDAWANSLGTESPISSPFIK